MKQVWKYPLGFGMSPRDVPKGAKFLTVGSQGSLVTVWALVDPAAEKETRVLEVVGTGWDVQELSRQYVGTAHSPDGFVWHVFEVIK